MRENWKRGKMFNSNRLDLAAKFDRPAFWRIWLLAGGNILIAPDDVSFGDLRDPFARELSDRELDALANTSRTLPALSPLASSSATDSAGGAGHPSAVRP